MRRKDEDANAPITLKLTVEELKLLTTLASDQLFRREFIDPRMPGHKTNSAELGIGKALVQRLKSITDSGFVRTPPARMASGKPTYNSGNSVVRREHRKPYAL